MAQGSEFDELWLVLPERDNRVLSRGLVETGVTRERSQLPFCAAAMSWHADAGLAGEVAECVAQSKQNGETFAKLAWGKNVMGHARHG